MPKTTTEPAPEPSRREQRRQQHQALSRLQLLDAAEDVFGRKGFYDTTLKEIAELAEFSVGSVYSFFDSKDDLFRQIFTRRGGEFMPRLRELVGSRRTPTEQLHDLVDFEIGFFREHFRFGRLFLQFSSAIQPSTDRMFDAPMTANYHETMALQADLFERGQRAGEIVSGDAWVLSRLFSGLISSFQALDPRVMSDDPHQPERMTVEELHVLVGRTFSR